MKTWAIIMTLLVALLPVAARAADANQMHYLEILPDQSATLEKTDLLILGPIGLYTGLSTTGAAVNVSTYEGNFVVVMGQGARSRAAHTSTVEVLYGFTSSPATHLTASTQTTATAKFTSEEFDFDTLQGTNTAMYIRAIFSNLAGYTTTNMVGDVSIVYDAVRSAAQTITGTGIDVSAYKGNATLVTSFGGAVNEASTYTNAVTFQHCATLNGTYTIVTNLAGTAGTESQVGATAAVETYPIDLGRLHKYLRAVSISYDDVGSVGVTLVSPMKSE